jgi:tryptophanyl-tRNA synthetase
VEKVTKKRILSGMRPTGKLHLGNLYGALKNWIDLQNRGDYDCYYFVADWHALTSDYGDTGEIQSYRFDMVIDWLSAGLDPEKSTFFVQSSIKEHAELFLLLGMITPLAWLERNPTYKEMKAELAGKDLSTFGFLGYPVPEPLLTDFPKLLGIDGRKMSKSYENSIYISDQGDILAKKVTAMFTDPQRMRKKDSGRPELCNVYTFHQIYSLFQEVDRIDDACRKAEIGCTECKKQLADRIAAAMKPIHDRRDYYLQHQDEVREIIHSGNARAARIAKLTMEEVREAIRI